MIRGPKLSPQTVEQMHVMRDSGKTLREIGEWAGVTAHHAGRVLRGEMWAKQKREHFNPETAADPPQAFVEEMDSFMAEMAERSKKVMEEKGIVVPPPPNKIP